MAHICEDLACQAQGSERLCAAMQEAFGPAGSSQDGKSTWQRSPCLGLCEKAPAAFVKVAGARPFEQALGFARLGSKAH